MGEIWSNKKISDPYYEMEFGGAELEGAGEIKPGQFLMLKVGSGCGPFLRRPFSFYRVKDHQGIVSASVLYRIAGRGTRMMAGLREGEKIDLLAPLGNGFSHPPGIRKAILVAGGIGVAPLSFLAEHMNQNGQPPLEIIFLYGGRSSADIIHLDWLRSVSSEVRICTDDGSGGSKMLASELFESYLKETGGGDPGAWIFSCGPKEMLKAVSRIAQRHGLPSQICLEAFMACGFGACLGCAVRLHGEDERSIVHERVCREGPVFPGERIAWND